MSTFFWDLEMYNRVAFFNGLSTTQIIFFLQISVVAEVVDSLPSEESTSTNWVVLTTGQPDQIYLILSFFFAQISFELAELTFSIF